jgi:hypothetical protein
MNEFAPSQESSLEDLLRMCSYSAEGDNNLNPPETDLWGSSNPDALLSTAIGGPSGGGEEDILYYLLGMQALPNIRQ